MFNAFDAIILEYEKSHMPENVNYSILRVECVCVWKQINVPRWRMLKKMMTSCFRTLILPLKRMARL